MPSADASWAVLADPGKRECADWGLCSSELGEVSWRRHYQIWFHSNQPVTYKTELCAGTVQYTNHRHGAVCKKSFERVLDCRKVAASSFQHF